MTFPKGNKYRNPDAPLDVEFGDNIKLLEQRLAGIDWKRLGRLYAIVLGTVLATLFLIIVTVRLALNIF